MVLDRNGYVVCDLKNKEIENRTGREQVDALDTRGGDSITDRHVANFVAAIRTGEALNSPSLRVARACSSVTSATLPGSTEDRWRPIQPLAGFEGTGVP